MMRRSPLLEAALAALTIALALAQAGCEDQKKKTQTADAGAPDSGPSQPLLDGKLGEAVAAAEATASARDTAPKKGGGDLDGPPEKGIFEPDAAAKAHPVGAPPKVEMLGEGAEPRASLAAKIEPGATRKVVLTLGLRAQAPIDVALGVTFKVDKPKDEKKAGADAKKAAGDAPKKAGEEASAHSGQLVVGKVTSVNASSRGASTDELSKIFEKMSGSQIRFLEQPDGSANGFSHELAKGADPGLDSALQALEEAMSIMIAPLPSKPVGVGGYWMVTDRARTAGIEVVRYRVYRVTKIEGSQVSLSMELRQYSTEASMPMPGGQKDAGALTLERFESRGKGDVTWGPGTFLPSTGDVSSQLQGLIIPPGQPNQRGQVQTETRLKLSAETATQ